MPVKENMQFLCRNAEGKSDKTCPCWFEFLVVSIKNSYILFPESENAFPKRKTWKIE